jgi:hypothetical protein
MTPRPCYEMPDFFRNALNPRGLMDAYLARPLYQQNDYIGALFVTLTKLESTRQKRLNQMPDEHGGVYMKMKWNG